MSSLAYTRFELKRTFRNRRLTAYALSTTTIALLFAFGSASGGRCPPTNGPG